MAKQTSKFLIGLFVTVGFLIGVIAIIWLGATRYFKKGATYVSYFDESVQGLKVDSSVRYRGVEAGRVKSVSVAPDDRLVQVVMKIYLKDVIHRNTVAQVSLSGLSGTSFVSLSPGTPEELKQSPKTDFVVKYPVIPTRPSELKMILSSLNETLGGMKQLDLKGISEQLKSTAKSVSAAMSDKRINTIMNDLESTAANLDGASRKIDEIVAEGDIKKILAETRETVGQAKETVGQARSLISELRDDVGAMKLRETGEHAGQLVQGLDSRTRVITGEIRSTLDNIRRVTERLDVLIERLNASPSDLIWSKPPPRGREKE
jgi:phospholipid/cholesterol/gamma-HCH transport system substrate-binding protein